MPASVEPVDTQLQTRTAALADAARLRLAAGSLDAADCRALGLMLGLMEVDPQGSLVKANPLDVDLGEPGRHSPGAEPPPMNDRAPG